MTKFEKCADALCRMVVAEDSGAAEQAKADIRKLMADDAHLSAGDCADVEMMIRRILLELGAPDHLAGHPYAIRAIQLCLADHKYIKHISFQLYPKVAEEFDTTASRVERAIRNLIEVAFDRGDMDMFAKYFGNTISPRKGKPTNGEFIARITNFVKMQLNEAA